MHDWGISDGYHDYKGDWCEVPGETLTAIREAMGHGDAPSGLEPNDNPVVTFRPGEAPGDVTAGGPWQLQTEDGGAVDLDDGAPLPPDLPLGYHRLVHRDDGRARLLVVSPGRCHLPRDLRTWGWAAQLYAT